MLLLSGAACSRAPERAPAIGEAYAGPPSLNLRSDFPLQSRVTATVKHGERLEILRRYRIFFLVRAPNGAQGWADERQLLGASDMQNLRRLAEAADKLPSQGQATPRYGALRVYMLPSRDAPSFVTLKDKERVDVLTHLWAPRIHLVRAPLLQPAPKRLPPRKKARESGIPPVPMPKPPPPAADWLALSKTQSDQPADQPPPPPVPTDDWTLVRTADGEAGWVLTRQIDMAIPDEVAQYAEGRRIVTYFALGSIRDGDQDKNNWVWTTIGEGAHPYDFDNFRVFIWSLRHHRYETSYIERNVAGFEPVLLEHVAYGGAQYPGFSVCLQNKDGSRARREFALLSNVIRAAGQRPCEAQTPPVDLEALAASANAVEPAPASPTPPRQKASLAERVKRRLRSWIGR